MSNFLLAYGLFFAKTLTLVVAILVVMTGIIALATSRSKLKLREKLEIKNINKKYQDMADLIRREILPKNIFKKLFKEEKKAKKIAGKKSIEENKKRIFVIKFTGDIRASEVNCLREEITAILTVATANDEVVVILESPGGVVPSYGLAASQLDRIKQKNIPLVVVVDKVAASGGYLMACVADRILAAPFSYIGSIGVVAQLPNFNKLLKKNHIEFEQITAGEFKRTLSLFGENTAEGRKKMKEEVEEIHYLFKDFIKRHRPNVDIDSIATGEYWPARRALELNLIDQLSTSDDYLLNASNTADIYEVTYFFRKHLKDKLAHAVRMGFDRLCHWEILK